MWCTSPRHIGARAQSETRYKQAWRPWSAPWVGVTGGGTQRWRRQRDGEGGCCLSRREPSTVTSERKGTGGDKRQEGAARDVARRVTLGGTKSTHMATATAAGQWPRRAASTTEEDGSHRATHEQLNTLEARAIIPSGLGSIQAHSPRLSLVADGGCRGRTGPIS